jgi:ABC-type multidrug transport system fused ATPase/permease subunit
MVETNLAIGSGRRTALPRTILQLGWYTTGLHQVWLSILTVVIFLLNLVPLELQRRAVDELVDTKRFNVFAWLAAAYLGANLLYGVSKAGLNIYQGWAAETASRALRRAVGEISGEGLTAAESGVRVSVTISEVDDVGLFIGSMISQPLLQLGLLFSTFGYMLFLQPWMALGVLPVVAIQLLFIPRLQRNINRRAALRVGVVRDLSARLLAEANRGRALSERLFETRVSSIFRLNLGIFVNKSLMNLLMNELYHLTLTGVVLVGGWLIITGRLEYGALAAFASALERVHDPWGDIVDYGRSLTNAQVKYRLIESFVARHQASLPPATA